MRKTTVKAKSPFIFRLPFERMTDRLGTSHAESKIMPSDPTFVKTVKMNRKVESRPKDGHHPEILAFFIDHGQGKDQTQDQ